MTRTLDSSFETAVTSNLLRPVYLCDFSFTSGDVNLWTGTRPVTWGGKNYTGVGNLLSIEPAEESSELEARSATFVLSGMNSALVALALDSTEYSGKSCRIYFGALDSDNVIIADPVQVFSGKMDTMNIVDDPNGSTLTLTAESDLSLLRRRKERRYTDEDQKLDYSADKGLEFMPTKQDEAIVWGR